MENTKISASERVMKSQKSLVAKGGIRLPGGFVDAGTAQVLADLVRSGYALTPRACIIAALNDAHKKINRK